MKQSDKLNYPDTVYNMEVHCHKRTYETDAKKAYNLLYIYTNKV